MKQVNRWVMVVGAVALMVWMVAAGCHSEPFERESAMEKEAGMETRVMDPEWTPMRQVEGEPLSEEEWEALTGRLPAMVIDEDDEVSFKRREESMAPPLTGEDVEGEWPPEVDGEVATVEREGSLRAQAFRPRGEVRAPFQVAIAFDRPVVEVGEVGQQAIPEVLLTPEVEGRWRWLGTQTLIFEPTDKWPQATEYEVRLAEGLQAVDGTALEEAVAFEFSTPPPQVQTIYPQTHFRSQVDVDSPVAVVFNQPVEGSAAEAVEVTDSESGEAVEMAVASAEELSETLKQWGIEEAVEEGRVVLLKPRSDYRSGATMEVKVEGPIESQEGPVLGMVDETGRFEVRGAFELEEVSCGHRRSGDCQPMSPIQLRFSNPVEQILSSDAVIVEPSVRNKRVQVMGSRVIVQGGFEARRDYEVRLEGEVRDVFGQALRGERSGEVSYGDYPPMVAGPDQLMVVRPMEASATLPLMVAGVESMDVTVRRVESGDWERFLEYRQMRHHSDQGPADPGGEVVFEETMAFGDEERQRLQEVAIDIADALEDGKGHAVVIVEGLKPDGSRGHQGVMYWVQRHDLGADLSLDKERMTMVLSRLGSGEAARGAEVWLGDRKAASADERGEVEMAIPSGRDEKRPIRVVAGADELLIPVEGSTWGHRNQRWRVGEVAQEALWYVVDDRGMYRPGEEVRLRGWIRSLERSPRSDLRLPEVSEVSYEVFEARQNKIAEGKAKVDGFGGFELDFEVPEGANMGRARVVLEARVNGEQARRQHAVDIQEFRRPEFEVGLSSGAGPHRAGAVTTWEGEANYYAGGALTQAPTTWRFSESAATYRPSGWEGWSFGRWQPWWSPWGGGSDSGEAQVVPQEMGEGLEGETDEEGRDQVEILFDAPEDGLPRSVEARLSVQDVNRQSWEATDSVVVHPSQVYVGVRSEDNFVDRQTPWEMEMMAVGIEGEAVVGRSIEVELKRRSWRDDDDEVLDRCQVESREEAVSCAFGDLLPGSYRAVATVKDKDERSAVSEQNFWVTGQDRRGAKTAQEEELILVPEKDEYKVGDEASLLVQSPYYPLDAVVELRRDGSYERWRVRLEEEDPTVSFEIEEAMIPNVHLRVQAVGVDEARGPGQFGSAQLDMKIDSGPRSLTVEMEHDEEIAPGEELTLRGQVVDAAGDGVDGAQVWVYGVDESVLALTGYRLADPLEAFYPARRADMRDIRSRSWLLLEADEEVELESETEGYGRVGGLGAMDTGGGAVMESAPMARAMSADGSGTEMTGGEPIDMREVFDALAFYRSDVVTDEEGRFELREGMPDSLTRYRLMAVAVEGERRFGRGESEVTARRPLMVRPSPPRFLNVGDYVDLPVVVHNQSDEAREVQVALRSNQVWQWVGEPGRKVRLEAGERKELRFAGHVDRAGTARLQVGTVSGELADAELVEIPVLTPATTEAFATYGSIGDGDEDALLEALRVPQEAYSEYGGLELQTSSTQLQALTDGLLYLVDYPFDFAEPLASRILSVIALYDVLDAFEAEGLPTAKAMRDHLGSWVKNLEELQRGDGGFGLWPQSRESHPFVSVHGTLALVRASQEGVEVDEHRLRQALGYLQRMERWTRDWDDRVGASVEAYALFVRHQQGGVSQAEVDDLIGRYGIEELSLEAMGWLLPLVEGGQWKSRLVERLEGQVQETAATAEFQESYSRGAHQLLHTSRRSDGVVLQGLMAIDEDHHLVEKVVRGLLGHRQRGRWRNTQENVFVLQALRQYFEIYEDVEPDFVARAWLGEEQVLEHEFRGRTTDRSHVKVPMSYLHQGEERRPVVFERDGKGRMYYRMGLRYAPIDRVLEPLNQGFVVERNYVGIDDEEDVRRVEGGWQIGAGARVRVELSMAVPARRNHVALVDWLPAGLEPLNPALSVTSVEAEQQGRPAGMGRWGWWGVPWYAHQNLRDERVEAFASQVGQGVYTYSYVARATTPGRFVAMPAKAEEMYHPETFGRSASEVVEVYDRGE